MEICTKLPAAGRVLPLPKASSQACVRSPDSPASPIRDGPFHTPPQTPYVKTILFLILALCVCARADKAFDDALAKSEASAIETYPDAGKDGSPLWKAIGAEIDRLEKIKSPILDDPDYPVMLAAKCAAKLGIAPVAAKPTPPQDPLAAARAEIANPSSAEAYRAAKVLLAEKGQAPAYRRRYSDRATEDLAKRREQEWFADHGSYPTAVQLDTALKAALLPGQLEQKLDEVDTRLRQTEAELQRRKLEQERIETLRRYKR